MLLASSNEGQIHAFDAGEFTGTVTGGELIGEYGLGTGKELFAHITRPMLQHTADMTTLEHDFGADGALVANFNEFYADLDLLAVWTIDPVKRDLPVVFIRNGS